MQRLASKLQLRQGSSSILTDKQQQEEEGASSWGDDAGTLKSPSIIMSQYTYTHQSLVYALGWSVSGLELDKKNHQRGNPPNPVVDCTSLLAEPAGEESQAGSGQLSKRTN
jgi:hypothetical protein